MHFSIRDTYAARARRGGHPLCPPPATEVSFQHRPWRSDVGVLVHDDAFVQFHSARRSARGESVVRGVRNVPRRPDLRDPVTTPWCDRGERTRGPPAAYDAPSPSIVPPARALNGKGKKPRGLPEKGAKWSPRCSPPPRPAGINRIGRADRPRAESASPSADSRTFCAAPRRRVLPPPIPRENAGSRFIFHSLIGGFDLYARNRDALSRPSSLALPLDSRTIKHGG